MKINTIIFDWDGTLGMTLHLWLAGYRHGLQKQGHSLADEAIARDLFYHHEKAQEKLPSVDFATLVTDAKSHLHENLPNLKLYQHAKETLLELRELGIKITLVTSSPRNLLEKGLEQHELAHNFSTIITGDDVTYHKPHPEPFIKMLEFTGSAPQETLIIGDSRVDILAGKAVGTKTCLFTPQENALFHDFEELRLTEPDATIDSLDQLLHAL